MLFEKTSNNTYPLPFLNRGGNLKCEALFSSSVWLVKSCKPMSIDYFDISLILLYSDYSSNF